MGNLEHLVKSLNKNFNAAKKIHEPKISLNDSLFVFSAKLRTSLSLSLFKLTYVFRPLDRKGGGGGDLTTILKIFNFTPKKCKMIEFTCVSLLKTRHVQVLCRLVALFGPNSGTKI